MQTCIRFHSRHRIINLGEFTLLCLVKMFFPLNTEMESVFVLFCTFKIEYTLYMYMSEMYSPRGNLQNIADEMANFKTLLFTRKFIHVRNEYNDHY